jgi:alanyl aminopeptidase
VTANDGGGGYYRVAYRGDLLGRLLGGVKPLSLAETVGALGDVQAMVASGRMAMGDALAYVPGLAADPRRQVVEEAATLAGGVHERLVTDRLRPNYRRFIEKSFGARARALGWQPTPTEDDDTRLLRPVVVSLVADKGEDRELRAQAVELTKRWVADRKAIAHGLVEAVLATAAGAGDASLYDLLYQEAKRSQERRDRTRILRALALFRDPKLARSALELVVSNEFDPRETTTILFGEATWPATRPLAWDFVKNRFDALAARWPADTLAFVPFVATSFCDEEHLTDMTTFFKDRSAKIPGGPRILAQATETLRLCIAYKKAHAASAAKTLARF